MATAIGARLRLTNLVHKVKTTIWNFNLFSSIPPATDALTFQKQRLSTRLFLLIFTFCLMVLIVYTAQVSVIRSVTVKNPTSSVYTQLFALYPKTLSCPCTTNAIPYKDFLQVNPSYHPVCSSDFVQERWINFLFQSRFATDMSIEFGHTGGPLFLMLAAFCRLVQQTIDDELLTVGNTAFVTAETVSVDSFTQQSLAFLDLTISGLENSFMRSLSLIRETTNSNGLASGLLTTFDYNWISYNPSVTLLVPSPHTFTESNCTCFTKATCISSAFITSDGTSFGTILGLVPGMYIGCYIVDGLLQSTLELLFDGNEIQRLTLMLYNITTIQINATFTALNETVLQQFTIQSSVNDLVSRLMVDAWTNTTSFEKYFSQCQPSKCYYSFVGKNSFFVIVTTVLGLIGGLNTILQLLVPAIVTHAFTIRDKFRHRHGNLPPIPREPRQSLVTQISILLIKAKHFIVQFNIFPSVPPSPNEHVIRNQRVSTWLFGSLMCISCIVLVAYTSQEKVTQTITVNQPSYSAYTELSLQYSQSLYCPCTTISIEQGTFVNTQPKFHQVCSSEFVSDAFFAYLLPVPGFPRSVGYSQFQFIDSLCQLTNESITDSLAIFKQNRFISGQVLSSDLFDKQVRATVDHYIQTIINSVVLSLSFISDTTMGNKLASGFSTNNYMVLSGVYPNLGIGYGTILYSDYLGPCDCLMDSCAVPVRFGNIDGSIFTVPNFYTGCYVNDVTLKSDLHCFFDSNCTALYLSFYNSQLKFNISTLDPLATRFPVTASIDTLLQDLFVENWTTTVSHRDYFTQCKPSSCSYTIETRNNWLTVLTITIGLIGGLQIVLRFLVPKVVQLIRLRCFTKLAEDDDRVATDPATAIQRLSAWQNFRTILLNYNIFPSYPPTTDANIRRSQYISTYLFIFVFSASLVVIACFKILVTIPTTVVVNSPSYSEYLNLYDTHNQSLQCPCMTIAVPYSSYMETNVSFHQICSSVYIAPLWLLLIQQSNELLSAPSTDFRRTGVYTFQIIASFCQLANVSVNNELFSFNSQEFVSNTVIERNLFLQQANGSVETFLTSAESDFGRTLQILRDTTQGNVLFGLVSSNMAFVPYVSDYTLQLYVDYDAYSYNDSTLDSCYCQRSATCVRQSMIFNASSQVRYTVPGMLTGCFPVEATLQSTLACFFEQTCIDTLRLILNETSYTEIDLDTVTLNRSLPSRYSPETTIVDIIGQLMIDNFSWSASHEHYYEQCRPSVCSYTTMSRNDVVYVLTSVLGLTGGLSSIFLFIIPRLVKLANKVIQRIRLRHRRQIEVHPF